MDIGKAIREAREALGMSKYQLAKRAGVSDVSITKWERGDMDPGASNLKAVADALGVSVSSLVGERDVLVPQPADAVAPVYGRIAAGEALEMMPDEGSSWVDPSVLDKHPGSFFLRITGDSMNEILTDGSLVLFDPDQWPTSGDIVAVNINGHDATVKQIFYAGDTVVLHPCSYSDEHRDVAIDSEDPDGVNFRILGVYTGWYKADL